MARLQRHCPRHLCMFSLGGLRVLDTNVFCACACVCAGGQKGLPPWWGCALSAMSLVQRRVIKGVMKLMTCYSCNGLPGPRLVSAAAAVAGALEPTGLQVDIERDTQGLSLF